MRTLFRHFLLLLIAFSLPITGWANVIGNAVQPCPMMYGAAISMHAAKASCCADLKTTAKTGNPCKAGQECKTGSLGQPTVVMAFSPVLNTSPLSSYQADHFLRAEPSSVWRPPRQI